MHIAAHIISMDWAIKQQKMPMTIHSLVNFFGLFRLLLGFGSLLSSFWTLRLTAFESWSSSGVNHSTLLLLLLQHLSRNTKLVDPESHMIINAYFDDRNLVGSIL